MTQNWGPIPSQGSDLSAPPPSTRCLHDLSGSHLGGGHLAGSDPPTPTCRNQSSRNCVVTALGKILRKEGTRVSSNLPSGPFPPQMLTERSLHCWRCSDSGGRHRMSFRWAYCSGPQHSPGTSSIGNSWALPERQILAPHQAPPNQTRTAARQPVEQSQAGHSAKPRITSQR